MPFCQLRRPQVENVTLDFGYFLISLNIFGANSPCNICKQLFLKVLEFETLHLNRCQKSELVTQKCENTFLENFIRFMRKHISIFNEGILSNIVCFLACNDNIKDPITGVYLSICEVFWNSYSVM